MGMDDPLLLAWPDKGCRHHIVLVAVDLRHPVFDRPHQGPTHFVGDDRGQDVMSRRQPRAGMGDVAHLRSMLAVPVAAL
ncbi:hypothetical protein AF71_00006310 [Rhizobium sp. 57MFTsu3.2]|nr:hypothetical protein [Rhizobium sp. 57MFTsu3.2]